MITATNSTLTRTQVYLDSQILQKAKIYAKNNNTNVSTLIRQGLKDILESSTLAPKKPQLRVFKLQDRVTKNYSEQIDTIYDSN
jgi:hypothetical protein